MQDRPLLSVHVPKCAGTSFRAWLESVFPGPQLLLDYDDRPIDPSSPMNTATAAFLAACHARPLAASVRAVHGHFWIRKYDHVLAARRITVLRHPLARTLSHYYFWLETPPHGHALHDRVLGERMTLLDFAALPQMRWFYRDHFFRDVDMATFDFIGDVDRLAEDIERLERLLGVKGHRVRVNENPRAGYGAEIERVLRDARVRSALETLLADDIAFFEAQMIRRAGQLDGAATSESAAGRSSP
ncbi:sulfotransferase family 2 domain-containing protein [Rhodoplanes sp. TEM]|uniref:Sulfotransferase family 2 domain-containing protein n=1 Tax=Rhodoplanes tepidamans TaxID=200616 RepID=A0ABT5JCL1_RHOTP|nr:MULTISPECIES: sulfotransferase family 2 domain-containing protein [Rhodoplanes]MDC7787411.1 sulfotransferase family 2 domain-containing protein [Rhodoplanes tepidamans]MDC7985530.1 sulfotransferase family 2 domain-containing protein [Rhodoplanes sp. TEM]MDQ0358103.1 hypothetical protein [Rhodoplanes tepidamans]